MKNQLSNAFTIYSTYICTKRVVFSIFYFCGITLCNSLLSLLFIYMQSKDIHFSYIEFSTIGALHPTLSYLLHILVF